MNRRDSLIALASLGSSLVARRTDAQAPKPAGTKIVGMLSPNPPQPPERARPVFERFATLGWIPGKNLAFERPLGQEDQLEEMAANLVRKQVDIIWAIGPEAAVAAVRATREIPIVFWGVAMPLELGVTDSLARPGNNATGVAFFTGPELYSKQLELLKIIAPGAQRLAWISQPSAARAVSGEIVDLSMRMVDDAARLKGVPGEWRLFAANPA